MSRAEVLAVLAGAGLVGVLAYYALADPAGLGGSVKADLSVGDGVDPARPHTCPAARMADAVTGRHPLYTRPATPGHNVNLLTLGGWGWYLNPPSEA